mmetsp:Transcript_35512/g.80131  ORF Transcript_35512/g.80131 Transcript_35512/m.80131 type:complete len:123 (+) Transcript_35512:143-511(+)
MAKALSVPIRLLHEGEGHTVSVELKNGEVYRGTLKEAEETMNCFLDNVSNQCGHNFILVMICRDACASASSQSSMIGPLPLCGRLTTLIPHSFPAISSLTSAHELLMLLTQAFGLLSGNGDR